MKQLPTNESPEAPETNAVAIADIKKYLDEETFDQLSAFLREKAKDRVSDVQNCRAAVAAAGAAGYQAQC